MSVRRAAAAAAFVIVLCSATAHHAFASPGVLLGFAEDYVTPAGESRTHHGVDLAVGEGDEAAAPIGGVVRFAGRVPGGDGASVLAVTIESEQGVVTLLPLEDAAVSTGERVEAGDAVGRVAGGGDLSSPQSHLHVGLKQGSVYLDPSVLFDPVAPAPSAGEPEPAITPNEAGAAVRPAAGAAPVAVVEAAQVAAVGGVQVAPADGPLPASSPAIAVAAQPAAASAGAQVAPGVSVSSAVPVQATRAAAAQVSPLTQALHGAVSGAEALVRSARRIGWPAVAALAASMVALLLLFSGRALQRRIESCPPVSDRLGSMLQQLRAGATIHGLTSCSGPLPSQSRGH